MLYELEGERLFLYSVGGSRCGSSHGIAHHVERLHHTGINAVDLFDFGRQLLGLRVDIFNRGDLAGDGGKVEVVGLVDADEGGSLKTKP